MGETQVYPGHLHPAVTKTLVNNLALECTNNTQVVIKQDSMVGAEDGLRIMTAAGDLTVDITNVGVKNGLDVGPELANTWYYTWMIMNIDTGEVAGLFSASTTSPTMPSGFTVKRLVGAVRNDASSAFRYFQQEGTDVDTKRKPLYSGRPGDTNVIVVSLASLVPFMANFVRVHNRVLKVGVFATGAEQVYLGGRGDLIDHYVTITSSPVDYTYWDGFHNIVVNSDQQIHFYQTDTNAKVSIYMDINGFSLNL